MASGENTLHPVTLARIERGWTQGQLAERAGVPRTTLSAMESRRLTPSVTAALAVAKALEVDVESLFSSGGGDLCWAIEPTSETVRYRCARVGDQVLAFPVEPLAGSPARHDGVWRRGSTSDMATFRTPALAAETLVLACCDPSVGFLAHALAREAGLRLIVLERGGLAALDLLRRGLVHAAGLHFSTCEDPNRNSEIVRRELGSGYSLIRVASWEEGLAHPCSTRHSRIASFAKRDTTWALREPGSAARDCLDQFLRRKRSPAGRLVSSHAAVAASVRAGWADVGICVRLSAEDAGLAFRSLRTESLDFCVADSSLADPRVKALLRILRSREHRRLVGELPGYDTRETGQMLVP